MDTHDNGIGIQNTNKLSCFLTTHHMPSEKDLKYLKSDRVLHKVIEDDELLCPDKKSFKRLLIVGDIHGCFEEFMLLIDLYKRQYNDENLASVLIILVGDIVNKGPCTNIYIYIYIYTCIHEYIHTCIHKYTNTY